MLLLLLLPTRVLLSVLLSSPLPATNPSIPKSTKPETKSIHTQPQQSIQTQNKHTHIPKPTNKLKSDEPKTNDSNPAHTDLTTYSHHRFNNPANTQTTTTNSNPATTEGTHIDSIPELKSSQHQTQQTPSLHDSTPTAIHHTNPNCTTHLHNPSPPHKPTAQTQCRSEEKRKGRRENERKKEEKRKWRDNLKVRKR